MSDRNPGSYSWNVALHDALDSVMGSDPYALEHVLRGLAHRCRERVNDPDVRSHVRAQGYLNVANALEQLADSDDVQAAAVGFRGKE